MSQKLNFSISTSTPAVKKDSEIMSTKDETQLQPIDYQRKDVILVRDLDRKLENVAKYNQEVEHLCFDGSNLFRWKTRTATAIFFMTNVSQYWDAERPAVDSMVDLVIDKCALRMIYSTIHNDLRDLIDGCIYAHDALATIERHFCPGGRTIQVATFRNLCLRTFDPATTPLLKHIQAVNEDMEKLERNGFNWTKDMLLGMLYQHGASMSVPHSMGTINAVLDAKYRAKPEPFKSSDIRAEMQASFRVMKRENKNSKLDLS
ncbi:hypothetical protein CROQUDRAFT_652482 [Cronartium quercuum f. sp. fusiforme G11]|uniref:Uncharacterized protein n=1 Tax=Cronartium quercuum f. sp. fusiforme G11 TaxID=708437 RepID=A0A9P6NU22_9BASI|nr:hypothetical protein CROQUDRAFT_652482 [Cronartium quercuum f. sp. fusiforme G11]